MRIRKTARPSNLPGGWPEVSKNKRGRPPAHESPSWVADWLKQQVGSYLRENASHFDKNGTRLWAMTEEQVIELCHLIYLAKRHHNDKRGYQAHDNYARRDNSREGEGDGFYLDKSISPELGRLK